MIIPHAKLTEHNAIRHKLKSCTVPFLYRSDLAKSRRMLYRPDVCSCTMPYVPCTVPAYAVRDPAYTAELFALTLVQIDVPWPFEEVEFSFLSQFDFPFLPSTRSSTLPLIDIFIL